MKKIVTIILILILSMAFISSTCYAAGIINVDDVQNPASKTTTISESEITDRAGVVIGVIRTIGIVVSVVALMYIGLKTMTGSIEEKSHYKQALPGYIVGLVMVAAITLLPSIIYNAVSGPTGEQNVMQHMLQAGEVINKIESGELDVTDENAISTELLKTVYKDSGIQNTLDTRINGDKREGNSTMELQEAVNKLGEAQRKIYNELVRRGCLTRTQWILNN